MGIKHIPNIIGAAQFTQRKGTPQPLDSLSLMVKTSQDAIKSTQTEKIIDFIDAVYMVNISSWSYEDAPGELSKKLGITPKKMIYLPDGGQSPQMLVNRASKAIASGEHRCILITGGEAAYTISKTYKGTRPEHWPRKKPPKYINGEKWNLSEIDKKYGLFFPSLTYAIFETALRASSGRTIEEHRIYMGKIMERFSKVAANNPLSWTQNQFTADEITIPSPKNQPVVYPYTKRMCANNFVDQAGSIIVTSEEIASALNIDKKYWIYIMGGVDLKNIAQIYRRPRLDSSPAIRKGFQIALDQAGLKLSDIDKFDLYSCFPSIVEILMKELGITEEDPRDLTVTGGLPYFGTPLSNYSLHAIINTVGLIRANPTLKIMIIANGGYNTKQSIGIYGTERPKEDWGVRDDSKIQKSILSKILPDIAEKVNGKLTVEGYSIIYDRSGQSKRAVLVGSLENGCRALAIITSDSDMLSPLESQDLVGMKFMIKYDSDLDRNVAISIE
jgi:acetyl-CoA C-acetyltransferase